MEQWKALKLDPGEASERGEGDVHINIMVSPYDVPTHIRSSYDKKKERFVIELKYIGEEPWEVKESEGPLDIRVGKNSGRLYGIEVDIQSLDADSVSLRLLVSEVVQDGLSKIKPTKPRRKGNFDLARQVVKTAEVESLYSSLGSS